MTFQNQNKSEEIQKQKNEIQVKIQMNKKSLEQRNEMIEKLEEVLISLKTQQIEEINLLNSREETLKELMIQENEIRQQNEMEELEKQVATLKKDYESIQRLKIYNSFELIKKTEELNEKNKHLWDDIIKMSEDTSDKDYRNKNHENTKTQQNDDETKVNPTGSLLNDIQKYSVVNSYVYNIEDMSQELTRQEKQLNNLQNELEQSQKDYEEVTERQNEMLEQFEKVLSKSKQREKRVFERSIKNQNDEMRKKREERKKQRHENEREKDDKNVITDQKRTKKRLEDLLMENDDISSNHQQNNDDN